MLTTENTESTEIFSRVFSSIYPYGAHVCGLRGEIVWQAHKIKHSLIFQIQSMPL